MWKYFRGLHNIQRCGNNVNKILLFHYRDKLFDPFDFKHGMLVLANHVI